MENRRKAGESRKNPDSSRQLNLVEKTFKAFEIPLDPVTGMAHLELSGNREAVIDGCRGILEYDENVVKIDAGKMIVKFVGTEFNLRSLTDHSAVLEGFISSVEFLF